MGPTVYLTLDIYCYLPMMDLRLHDGQFATYPNLTMVD